MKATIFQGEGALGYATQQLFPHHSREDQILDTVASRYHVHRDDLTGPLQHAAIVWPRHLAMALTRQLTTLSLEQIGMFFGGRDHSSVIHAVKRVRLRSDLAGDHPGEYQKLYRELSQTLDQ